MTVLFKTLSFSEPNRSVRKLTLLQYHLAYQLHQPFLFRKIVVISKFQSFAFDLSNCYGILLCILTSIHKEPG